MTATQAVEKSYSIKAYFDLASGAREKWFATFAERAAWCLVNGYSSNNILGFANPENDQRVWIFDVTEAEADEVDRLMQTMEPQTPPRRADRPAPGEHAQASQSTSTAGHCAHKSAG